jgi:hypothetical protein
MALNRTGKFRADVIAVNMKQEIVIVETKSSIADFKNDKKWQNYRNYCNKFFFAMPASVYEKVKHLIPKDVGTFVITNGYYSIKGRTQIRPIDANVKLDVITRIAFRGSSVQKYKLKATISGAKVVAQIAVNTIQAMPRKSRIKQQVIDNITIAISKYV